MTKSDRIQNESLTKGNSEDSLLVIYVLNILKKYSSPKNPLSSQDVMEYLKTDYSIGYVDKAKAEAQKKKVRRHLDTLYESYPNGCIKKEEGKTRGGHRWYYDISRDNLADEKVVVQETLSKEEIDFIIDIITSSKIINSESTVSIVNKLLKKTDISKEDRRRKLGNICREDWSKSLNDDLVSLKKEIDSYIDEWCKIKFDYENTTSVLATPYGWNSDESGKYILVAKVDGQGKGEFSTFYIEKIQNIEKAEYDYSDYDDTYFDRPYLKPDKMSLESLFSNIRTISDAIEKKNGIEFEYLTYVIRDTKVVLVGNNKRVMPHSFVFNDGKYYLIGYDESSTKIEYYRVDLISDLSCSDTKIEISDWNTQMLSGIQRAREAEKHPLMLVGKDIPVTFKVVESALDRVIDAFGIKTGIFNITKEIREVKNSSGEVREERVVSVQVRTTLEEAYRWALSNADAVEIVTQEIRDKIARVAEPIYKLYTQTLSDKVRENLDVVLKKGKFEISSEVDEETAYATYKALCEKGQMGSVKTVNIYKDNIYGNIDYIGNFINTKHLIITDLQCRNISWASKLVNVEILDLMQTDVDDVSWISEMKKLRRVYMAESSVSDLSMLSEHENIDYLDISGTNIRDISFIEKFQKLSYLNIVECLIDDYSPLFTTKSNFKSLEINKRTVEKIGEGKIKNRHIGITLLIRSDSPFWRFLI